MRAMLVVVTMISTLVYLKPAHGQDDAELKAYALAEPGIRANYSLATEAAQRRLKEGIIKEIGEEFEPTLKRFLYNKASALAFCNGRFDKSRAADECYEKWIAAHKKADKILEDYGLVLDKAKAIRCEMNARQFEREHKLQPYSFLKAPNLKLIDYDLFGRCLQELR